MDGTQAARWRDEGVRLPCLPPAGSDEAYQLHLAALEHGLASTLVLRGPQDIRSRPGWAPGFEPFDHQVRNLVTYCRRGRTALVADDVGLGKTISAGLVLAELRQRKLVERALVVAPKVLLPQWCRELGEKFGIHAVHATGAEVLEAARSPAEVVVTTYDTARTRMPELERAGFQMLVLDEAHKLRNLHGQLQGPPRVAVVMRDALRRRRFARVLMLTATPIQNRLWDLYSLVDLLAVANGHANPLGAPRDFADAYLADGPSEARRLKPSRRAQFQAVLSDYMVRTSRGTSHLPFPRRSVQVLPCEPSGEELRLHRRVAELVAGQPPVVQLGLMLALLSSPAALAEQLDTMAAREKTVDPARARELAGLARLSSGGCKLDNLLDLADRLREAQGPAWRMVVFTQRRATQEVIGGALQARGVRVGYVRGGAAQGNERAIERFCREQPEANVLVSTDAGAEGINLQAANVVVNYDLPWNPMVVEQRIGRVQRLMSRHASVQVLNLVVAHSIEQQVIVRLVQKLQAISDSLGDVDGILETAGLDSQDVEDRIRDLVLDALRGVDVERAVAQMEESIRRGKEAYEAQRASVERELGGLEGMHTAGPDVPDLAPTRPRMDVRELVVRALRAGGAEVLELPGGRVRVESPGADPFVATFDPADRELRARLCASPAGPRMELYAQGSPAFERLVEALSQRDGARVTLPAAAGGGVVAPPGAWLATLGAGAGLASWQPQAPGLRFEGELVVRATAAVGHDRYQKLCTLRLGAEGRAVPAMEPRAAARRREAVGVDLARHVEGLEQAVRAAVEADADLAAFRNFYEQRLAEELAKAGGQPSLERAVRRRFEPALEAELVAAQGHVQALARGMASVTIDGAGPYTALLGVQAATGEVADEPPRATCAVSGRRVPADWLGTCSVSQARALRHLLEASARSGRLALPAHLVTCAHTGRRLLDDEVAASDVSGRVVDSSLLQASAVSGRRGLEGELARCAFTGAWVLPGELRTSAVSGQPYRMDEEACSSVSGVRGHRSELVACALTGAILLPGEAGTSSVSGRRVRHELLVPSQLDAARVGTPDELVTCVVTQRRLLVDEVQRCSVTGQLAGRDVMGRSERSGVPALPSALVPCQATGALLLPGELAPCEASQLRVDSRLLVRSAFSGRMAQASLMAACAVTGRAALPSELEACAATGQRVDPNLLVTCEASGERVLRRTTVPCTVCGQPVRPERAVRSQSGRLVHARAEAVTCPWTGWILLRSEARPCPRTHALLAAPAFGPMGLSAPHEQLLREHAAAPEAHGPDAQLARKALALHGVRPSRLWVLPAPEGPGLAVLGEVRQWLGLRRRLAIAFVDRSRAEVLGSVAECEPAAVLAAG